MTLFHTLRNSLAGFAAGCVLMAVLAGPAPATPRGAHSIEVRRTASVLWLETSLREIEARRVTVRVFAPTGENGRRRLWQYCTVEYVGLGTYRCGVDFSKGTAARRARGEWAVRLLIDGKPVARKVFEVPTR